MSIITMNMSSYVIEEASPADEQREMVKAWAHRAEPALRQQVVEQTGKRITLPPSLAHIDAEVFLQEMRAYRAEAEF